ncbi:ubiquitin-associated protein 1 [Dendroctonus ponderosae]|uniref:UBA domain-containing protein n=1 Tax=Dendroctonus ponderosae TaxID=77166 RepID=A0AAR5PNI1_DENPD|nr:ubiquitin-associated protein 1 [Dendroctonus ponderosae]XP_019762482.1 ubiquitin-associated protein 1 [Dendroctonus ponderosae]KAH1005321.1 hypothetical protein HUJ04_006325 [Dendroctonus ponderosae]KAH1012407.1 hypothetical protein HUJ05_011572 [Dendroctonus ponderosae]
MANSYVDDIKVKISEKYKPPCRISLPMSYSQRLTLNKQLQDSRPTYELDLEKSILGRLDERKQLRSLAEDRKQKIEQDRREFKKKIEQEQIERLEKMQAEAADNKLLEEASKEVSNADLKSQGFRQIGPSDSSQTHPNYITKNGILMPIPVANNYPNSTRPLSSTGYKPLSPNLKPFNLADFESDTSSPFDNMELKSINDLEELAQVLKTNFTPNVYPSTSLFQSPTSYNSHNATKSQTGFSQDQYGQSAQIPQNPSIYSQSSAANPYSQIASSYSQVNSSFSQFSNPYRINPNNYQVPNTTNYSGLNGYMYNIPPQATSQAHLNYSSNPYSQKSTVVPSPLQKSNCKSVPDLVKSIEKELTNTHLSDNLESRHSISSSGYTTTNVVVPKRPKSTDSVCSKTKMKHVPANPLDQLSSEKREICLNVTLMGFPLDRVIRACEVIGCDQKKIVDHLLALSELLDLGFSEKAASEALANNDNDRDRALDLLIS